MQAKGQKRFCLWEGDAIVVPVLLAAAVLLLSGCTSRQENVLAVVGSRVITVDDFKARCTSLLGKMNLPDNGQVRKEIFRTMIDEELLLVEAQIKGYDSDPAGKHERERIEVMELLDAYLQNKVFKHITVKEEELRDLHIRMNTQIRACHLYASSKKQADSLYAELVNDLSFEEAAKTLFTNPQLRDTGGSLGTFTVDEMDPAFEEAAFALNMAI
jgi:parvulin-like peptidyl-prolyl isomerase